MLAQYYPGWTLSDLKSLSPRERMTWLNQAVLRPKVVSR